MAAALAITAIAYFLAPIIANNFWGLSHLSSLVQISLLIGLFSALGSIPSIYFKSLKKFGANAIIKVFQGIVSITGILVLAYFDQWSIEKVIFVVILSTIIWSIASVLIVPTKLFFAKSEKSTLYKLKNIFKNPIESTGQAKYDNLTPNLHSI